jgi:DNA-binding beta-propeller fold protein YncE
MEWEKYKVRLIVLVVLLLVLAVVAFFLTRKSTNISTVGGTNFGLALTIYDLQTPLGVTADDDENIYVADTGHSRLSVYDRDGNLLFKLESLQDDKTGREITFPSPYGLAVDNESGKLYVCDYSVYVLDKSGKFLSELTIPPGVVTASPSEGRMRPNEVALSRDRVFVTSRDGIYIWDKNTGQFLEHWGTRGKGVGQYDFPNGIAVDASNGNIFVADTNNWRIVALTPDGKVRWTLGNQEKENVSSPFHLVRSVAVGTDGLVYVTDAPDRIVVLDQDGNLKSILGERGTQETKLNFPEGLFISSHNRLYLADRENNRIQVWQLSNQLPVPSPADVDKFKKALKAAPL